MGGKWRAERDEYDGKALSQALEAILGRRDPKMDRSRRNTLEH
jgi:hypothetical protein